MTPEIFSDQLSSVIRDLIVGVVIYFAYTTAREAGEKNGRWAALWKGTGWCAGLAIIGALLLGQPTCAAQDDDPIRGSCIEHADDGYVPSTEARLASFMRLGLLLFIPVVAGVMNSRRNALYPWRKPEVKRREV